MYPSFTTWFEEIKLTWLHCITIVIESEDFLSGAPHWWPRAPLSVQLWYTVYYFLMKSLMKDDNSYGNNHLMITLTDKWLLGFFPWLHGPRFVLKTARSSIKHDGVLIVFVQLGKKKRKKHSESLSMEETMWISKNDSLFQPLPYLEVKSKGDTNLVSVRCKMK